MTQPKLKIILEKQGIGLREFARLIKEPATNVSNIVNKGQFTRKAEKRGLRKKIISALKERGVPEADLFQLFKPVEKTNRTGATAAKPPLTGASCATWENEMLRQETLDFFNLIEDPFEGMRGLADIFRPAAYKRVKKTVDRAIKRRLFMAVWGDVGSGKTTLWREIEAGLGDKFRVIKPVILEKERLTVYNLQEAIITDLKAKREDYTTGMKSSKEARDRQIRNLLMLYDEEGIGCVLVIEEAHTLPLRTLKSLKRLHEIQRGFSAPLSIILLGQTELKVDLWDDLRIREVTRRCRLVELPQLRPAEIPRYIQFKFERAREKPAMITADGYKALSDVWKEGISPLQLNNVISHILNTAADVGKKKINADMIFSLTVEGRG
jgi:type II secretory pathway predicted ATPase ExeA